MITKDKLTEKFFENIKKDAKLCIYGSNNIAGKICDILKETRKDVTIKFFADTKKSGEFKGLPLYLGKELPLHKGEIDSVIVASYSARYFLELILKRFGIKNIYLMDKETFCALEEKTEKKIRDVEKSASVFSTEQDRELYKFIAKIRSDRVKYLPEIQEYFNKNYPQRYMSDSMPKEHYLEYINKDAIKTVVDGGGFDGFTSVIFSEEFKNCEKIFMFEPCYDSFKTDLIDTVVKNDKKIEIINKGLWSKDTTLEFREETQATLGSAIVEAKPGVTRPHKIIKINTTSIDSFAKERNVKIDFIKLDVENAEMPVLRGAENVIKTHRPQLAISIYHTDEQFYSIPLYLKELLIDYELHFAHYSGRYVESVLYAIPKELGKE